MTNVDRCLQVLREGPATAAEIAAEVGMTSKAVCDLLKGYVKSKRVRSRPFVVLLPHQPERQANLYELADYGVQS